MQVSLNTSSLSSADALGTGVIKQQQPASQIVPTNVKTAMAKTDYPASPLISARPQRYSVQLNDQLTCLQEADHYLGQLEQQLLDYRHQSRRGGEAAKAQKQAVESLLEKRPQLSSGTVDNQLRPVLQGEARVSFLAPQLSHAMQAQGEESVLLSASKDKEQLLAAVHIEEDKDPRQLRAVMNNALRRVGIQSHAANGDVHFSTREENWPQLQTSLAAIGGGNRFAAGSTTAIVTSALPSHSDNLLSALKTSGTRLNSTLQQTLEHIGQSREQLATQQEKARQMIDGMARYSQSQNAEQASQALSKMLNRASHNYQTLAEAVNGQASLSSLTVRSLLS